MAIVQKIFQRDGLANRLLLSLPPATLARLMSQLEPVPTKSRQVIDHLGDPIRYLYFVNGGLVSLVKTMRDGRTVEIGAIGIEGITDPNALFGEIDNAILEAVVQVPGALLRIERAALRREMDADEALKGMVRGYIHFYLNQIIQTAACNRLHALEERCCRWLLLAHDSALSDSFPLTHEFLAMMLGVQRAGVTIAASFLQRAGLIHYTRGHVTVTDRAGLEDAACECYGALHAELDRLFKVH
ncbi:MAG TPA: Crp/Fnr family transcriptional regulator [Alphaproteobacteria bacterium]|nr:Crp/Fnr family transcriptional regulator [Alphaproteobacteria bacterium]